MTKQLRQTVEKKGDRNTWSLLSFQMEWKLQPGVGDRF
jgi:hypothetical protein